MESISIKKSQNIFHLFLLIGILEKLSKFCFGYCLETAVGNTRTLKIKSCAVGFPKNLIPVITLMTCEVKRISQSNTC